jgi:hypothetical protein
MPVKKLTQEERLVNEQMLAMLEWASEHPARQRRRPGYSPRAA